MRDATDAKVMQSAIFDSHIHLTNYAFDNEFPFLRMEGKDIIIDRGSREQVIRMMRDSGIGGLIEPAIEFESNERIIELAENYPDLLFPAIGVHPTRTYKYFTINNGVKQEKVLSFAKRKDIEKMAAANKVVAIGETGLDYHLARTDQHRIRQILWFIWQIRLADRLELPLILHIREADTDALRILHLHRKQLHGGVCHCFTGNAELAGKYTDQGLMLGVGGALLSKYEERSALEDAVINTPIENILLETDGPYVKPDCPGISGKQLRKARNTSLILPAVSSRIAELKGMTQVDVEVATAENVRKLFNINENIGHG